jgi:endonuclease-3 related protein
VPCSLQEIYDALDAVYRDDVWHWMPDIAPDPMQIMAGAVLVQHTTWTNAERALGALQSAGLLDPHAILSSATGEIEALVRVSGTPSLKARRLRALCEALVRGGGVGAFLAQPADELRGALLATHGIGPETADAIALYAGGKPLFVIDAYTRRIFRRLGLGPEADGYDTWQRYFEQGLADTEQSELVDVYRRYHGHLVLHAKALCRTTPRCGPCPLLARCPGGGERTQGAPRAAASGAAS